MKRQLLTCVLLPCLLNSLHESSYAHGGTYRGLGNQSPPTCGNGPGPRSASPAGPAPSKPSGPASPSPASPPSRAGRPGGGLGRPSTPSAAIDLSVWDLWWNFNKDPYLNLKSKLHDDGVLTGSDEFFLGLGQEEQARDSLRPSPEQIRGQVVPALLRALEKERSNDILTGAMIALAKIGDVQNESGESEFEKTISAFLKDGNQEVAETAAISLGILANDASVPALISLMKDSPEGRQLVGNKTEVPYRSRAFAAFGLGLIGNQTASNAVRQEIVKNLVEILNAPHFSTRDVKVAAMTALGLTPVDMADDPTALEASFEDPSAKAASCLQSQIAFLLDYINPDEDRANKTTRHYFVQSHVPTALGRLLANKNVPAEKRADMKQPVFEMLSGLVSEHSKAKNEVMQSTALAYGLFGDSDADAIDKQIRKDLARIVGDGELQQKRFALIALAQAGGRPGEHEQALDGVEPTRATLLAQLSRGRTLKPWAALSLGVFGHSLLEAGQMLDPAASLALRSAAADVRSPADAGAYCLALGLRRDSEGKQILLDKLEFFQGSHDARGYAAIALGLLQDRSAIAPIQRLVQDSRFKPDLLEQAAIALGLLGDKQVVAQLIEMLGSAKSLATQAAISTALGAIGDARSIEPLIELLENEFATHTARGFAAVALGIVCDKQPLPWNSALTTGINYRASTPTLTSEDGTGVLEIL